MISNTVIFCLYFFLLKFFINDKKIFLIIHSHITKKKLSQYIVGNLCSILSIFSDKVIFVSKFTREWWTKRFPFFIFTNSICKYNLVQTKKNNIKNLKKKFFIGFIGRLDKEKNVEKFLEIAEKAKKESFLNFVIYGDGIQRNIVKKNKFIIFKKWTKQKKFLKKIDLLLITSPIENCPYSVLETKSCGIPTLNLAQGGVLEIIKHQNDGISLNTKDYNVIISYIKHIKKNYSFFSRNCLINSKKFNIDKLNYLFKL